MTREDRLVIIYVALIALIMVGGTSVIAINYKSQFPRFSNGTSYAESTYTLTRQALEETAAIRGYVRQLPWPEDGWIFREWAVGNWRGKTVYDGYIYTEFIEGIPVDSLWVRCSKCGRSSLRYELRGSH